MCTIFVEGMEIFVNLKCFRKVTGKLKSAILKKKLWKKDFLINGEVTYGVHLNLYLLEST